VRMQTRDKVNPHQLDYDWQFDAASQDFIFRNASELDEILLLGCPTLMVKFDLKQKEGLLVERNPLHLPTGKFQVEYRDLRFCDQADLAGSQFNSVFALLTGQSGKDAIKVLVLHHHLLPIYEREPMGVDGRITLTLDAAKLLRQAQEANICVVLHGHQHTIKKMQYASWSAEMNRTFQKLKNPLTIFAAGSAGSKRDRLPNTSRMLMD